MITCECGTPIDYREDSVYLKWLEARTCAACAREFWCELHSDYCESPSDCLQDIVYDWCVKYRRKLIDAPDLGGFVEACVVAMFGEPDRYGVLLCDESTMFKYREDVGELIVGWINEEADREKDERDIARVIQMSVPSNLSAM